MGVTLGGLSSKLLGLVLSLEFDCMIISARTRYTQRLLTV